MSALYYALSGAALLCLIAAGWHFNHYMAARQALRHRLQADCLPALTVSGRLPHWLRSLTRECAPLAARLGQTPERLHDLLGRAGNPGGLTGAEFQGLRAALALLASAGGGLLALARFIGPFSLLFSVLLAWFGPLLWLRGAAQERQALLAATLPDFLDQLSVGLAAGMATDAVLRLVAAQSGGPVGEEIARYARQVELGVERSEALAELRRRNAGAEVELLVQSLQQSYHLGVPVAAGLAQQARHLRSLQAEKARDLAARASPKVILATTFLITPGVMLFVLGLLILNLIYNPSGFGLSRLFG